MPQKSLGHEVNELTSSRLLKLEMENQSLLKTVEELQSAVGSVEGSSSRILKMEKENQRLSKKVKGRMCLDCVRAAWCSLLFSFWRVILGIAVILGRVLQGFKWSYSVFKFIVKNKTTFTRFFSFLVLLVSWCENVTSLFRKVLDQWGEKK